MGERGERRLQPNVSNNMRDRLYFFIFFHTEGVFSMSSSLKATGLVNGQLFYAILNTEIIWFLNLYVGSSTIRS
jgi:hypothetical protein